ncbi:MAG: zinc ABC transporter substrate-binding protein [Armatimonadetes bacterium]|nr:zinc ABC transporter substrate-binding protein [Armatimonadota bacterium]
MNRSFIPGVGRWISLLAAGLSLLALPGAAFAKVNIVATTTDLMDIARSIGGNKVDVTVLSRGVDNPHAVEPRPSQVIKLTQAALLLRIGMDLDMWVDSLIDAARNGNIARGGKGYVDCSTGIKRLEIPTERVDASMGDIHIYGNPHYWLDPLNGKIIARNILNALQRVDPSNAESYAANFREYARTLDQKADAWERQLAPFKGAKIVTYHKSLIYFLKRFGFVQFGEVEPKPGIKPSPSHVNQLIREMKSGGAKVIMMEPFYEKRYPDLIARETGAKVAVVPPSVNSMKGIDTYIEVMDAIVSRVAEALK